MLKRNRRISREDLKSLEKPVFYINKQHISARGYINQGNVSKFSFTVSKKVEKSAVVRNKMRRLGYDTIRENLEDIKNGFFIRFVFNTKYNDDLVEDIKSNILEILSKANLIQSKT